MKLKSFTKTIYTSTLISSLIINAVAVIFIYIVCSSLITNIYTSQFKISNSYLNNLIEHVIDNSIIYKKLDELDKQDSNVDIYELKSLISQKSDVSDSLYNYIEKIDSNLYLRLPETFYNIYNSFILGEDIQNKIVKYSGNLYIVDVKNSNNYLYLQFFNLTKSNEIHQLSIINGLLGFIYKDEYIFNDNVDINNINNKKNLKYPSVIDNLYYYYSDNRIITDNLILFLTILGVSIIRIISTLLDTRRNLKTITRPLNDLVVNTEKLASHEVSEKLNRFDYPYREFKKIAETFNKVLLSRELSEIKLFRSFEQMESVVHKRTQELIVTNEQLTSAMKKAEEANALKSQFLANISHEIRTPLNCIMGFCDIILTEDHSPIVTIQVQQILHESETLLHLINDFLDYSKIDAGKMSIIEAELDIRSLVNSLLKSGQIQTGGKDINLVSHIDDDVPALIISDELRLYQVISNIFYNAIKFTSHGDVSINISSTKTRQTKELLLIIEVADSGIGIPEDRLESIFNKFEQVDGSLTRKYRGSGLGLTICKKIIDMMHGDINVTSEVNAGSKFTITLPVKSQPVLPNKNSKNIDLDNADEHTKGSQILLVEDYAVNQIVAKKHLEMDNHVVTIAENGQEALDMCEEKRYDLILMDLQMPILDGFKATKEIRSSEGLNQKTPILAMTANAMDTAKQTCLDTGMDGIITKPIRKKMFLREVDKWLKLSTE